MKSDIDANAIIQEFSGQPFSSLDSLSTCLIYVVQDIQYNKRSSSSIHFDVAINIDENVGNSDGNDENNTQHDTATKYASFVPFLHKYIPGERQDNLSTPCMNTSSMGNTAQETKKEDDDDESTETENSIIICVVCLESLSARHLLPVFTMYCGHSFHCTCVTRLESPQCPVCRSINQ